ncbi:MAG: beta-eliminating lyase-related protein [Sporolactobacillus sp.]|nr:beta-eliminating lyase-related protein [Sporolactobacillus sp.]
MDYRTDSGTLPTEAMREAMRRARLGDDYYREDPSVNELERFAADLLGKEAALLTTTATLGNQLALMSLSTPAADIWLEAQSHIATHDYAAFLLPGSHFHTYPSDRGTAVSDIVLSAVGAASVFCIENTHNRHGGTILPLCEMKRIYLAVHRRGGTVHLDGSRLFNASVATGITPKLFASCADTIVLCLCKGLCAPVGALLLGPQKVIDRARKLREKMGGGMPQAGIIAAPGLVALQTMIPRLAEDHRLAKALARGLARLPHLTVESEAVQTNIVLVHPQHPLKNTARIVAELKQAGILVLALDAQTIRFVTDRNIEAGDVEQTIAIMRQILS